MIGEAGRAAQAVFGDVLPGGPVYGGSSGGSGRFEMDAAELASVIGLWQDQLEKITADGVTIKAISDAMKPPGQDPASGGYTTTGLDSLAALQQQNDSMKVYVQGYIKKLQAAKDKTVAADQAGSESFGRAQ
jgi:hypothetical protein